MRPMPRGAPPKPTALETLQGNPSHRPVAADPKPDPAPSTAPPRWLRGRGRRVWEAMAPELLRLGLLSKLDVATFASGCYWWGVFLRCARDMRKDFFVDKGGHGRVPRPEVALALKAHHTAMDVF